MWIWGRGGSIGDFGQPIPSTNVERVLREVVWGWIVNVVLWSGVGLGGSVAFSSLRGIVYNWYVQ